MSPATLQVITDYAPAPPRRYAAPFCTVRGATTSAVAQPDGFDQWIVVARLDEGSEIEWSDHHGDEALYLVDGVLEVDGRTCHRNGAVVVEAGVPAVVRARRDSQVVHFGSSTPAAPTSGLLGAPGPGGCVHVVDADGIGGGRGEAYASAWYADSNCPTCRITLLRVWGDRTYVSKSHSHSEPELIHVTTGALQVGPRQVRAGATVAIPADTRYGFRSTPTWAFVNYRRDVSRMTRAPGSESALEVVTNLDPSSKR